MSRDKRDSDDESKEMNYLKYSLQNLLLLPCVQLVHVSV